MNPLSRCLCRKHYNRPEASDCSRQPDNSHAAVHEETSATVDDARHLPGRPTIEVSGLEPSSPLTNANANTYDSAQPPYQNVGMPRDLAEGMPALSNGSLMANAMITSHHNPQAQDVYCEISITNAS